MSNSALFWTFCRTVLNSATSGGKWNTQNGMTKWEARPGAVFFLVQTVDFHLHPYNNLSKHQGMTGQTTEPYMGFYFLWFKWGYNYQNINYKKYSLILWNMIPACHRNNLYSALETLDKKTIFFIRPQVILLHEEAPHFRQISFLYDMVFAITD